MFGSNFVHDVKQYEAQVSEDGLPLYGLHYADFQKWGINPRTSHFPVGVYFYFLSKKCESALGNGFATDRKYANIGRLNLDKFLIIKKGHPRHFGEDALNAAIDRIEAKYGKGSTANPDYHSSKISMDWILQPAYHLLELFRVILGMEKQKTIRSFNECLHDAGYDGILDINGAFLPVESCQGVQTWPGDAVEYVQSIRTPFRRERDGYEARTHNPYPEERYKNALKQIRQYKPGTLRLTDDQFQAIVRNVPQEQRFDMATDLLARMDLSNTSADEVDYVSRFMITAMNHSWDVLERNPTTPAWFWKYAMSHGDEGARATARDVLAAKEQSGPATLSESLFFNESKKQLGQLPFNMSEFKELYDILKQRDYLNSHAMYIGAGSSRIAYAISPKWVIKLAGGIPFKTVASSLGMVETGAAQNAAEVENYEKAGPEAKKLLPRTVAGSSNFNWIVTELVRPVTGYNELRRLAVGTSEIVDSDGVIITMVNLLATISRVFADGDEFSKEELEGIQAVSGLAVSNFIGSVTRVIEELGIAPWEISSWKQWGKSADGRLVLLDFGGTEDVIEEYY